MKNAKHLVIVDEDEKMVQLFIYSCALLNYRSTVVPFTYIQHGRAASFIATLPPVDAVIVGSYFPRCRMVNGDEIVASIHATLPKLTIIGCGGDNRRAMAMSKAGAKAFVIRGMRTKMSQLFEVIKTHLGQADAGIPAPQTPGQS